MSQSCSLNVRFSFQCTTLAEKSAPIVALVGKKISNNYGEVHVYSFGMDIFKQYIFSLNEERKYVQQKFNFILPILSQYSYLGNMKYESSII